MTVRGRVVVFLFVSIFSFCQGALRADEFSERGLEIETFQLVSIGIRGSSENPESAILEIFPELKTKAERFSYSPSIQSLLVVAKPEAMREISQTVAAFNSRTQYQLVFNFKLSGQSIYKTEVLCFERSDAFCSKSEQNDSTSEQLHVAARWKQDNESVETTVNALIASNNLGKNTYAGTVSLTPLKPSIVRLNGPEGILLELVLIPLSNP